MQHKPEDGVKDGASKSELASYLGLSPLGVRAYGHCQKFARWTWILLSEGQTLPYYTKGTSRTKIRPSYVFFKIIVFRPLVWAVDHLYRRRWRKSRFGRFLYIPLVMVSSYFVILGREALQSAT